MEIVGRQCGEGYFLWRFYCKIDMEIVWELDSPGMHILTWNGDVTHRECTSSTGMRVKLAGDTHPHQEFIFSLGMRM